MKVLLANPPAYIKDYNRHFIQAGSRWSFATKTPKGDYGKHYHPYPFFLGYSSALLKRDVPEVETKALDGAAMDFDEKEFLSYVKKYSPDILIIEIPTISFSLMMDVLKEVKETTGCAIAVAGPHITALTEEVMKENEFIDYCLLGEYEITVKDLVSTLVSGCKKVKEVDGVVFRDNGGLSGKRRPLVKDLDFFPFPDREDLPVQNYHNFEIVGEPCVPIWTSRGCPYNCAFCVFRQVMYVAPLYRRRNAKKIVDEMEFCKEKYGAKQIFFDDDTVAPNKNHLKEICNEILARKLDLYWTCMGDVSLDFQTLALMKKAKCIGVAFGIETINSKTLKNIGKAFVDADKAKLLVKNCRKLGIFTHATYMVGLPTDTKESIQTTSKFALELDTDGIQVSIAVPFPGTPFFDMAVKNGWLLTKDWERYNGAENSVVSYPHLSKEEIEHFYRVFSAEWRKEWGRRVFRWYFNNPCILLRYIKNYGTSQFIKKAFKVVKSIGTRKK